MQEYILAIYECVLDVLSFKYIKTMRRLIRRVDGFLEVCLDFGMMERTAFLNEEEHLVLYKYLTASCRSTILAIAGHRYMCEHSVGDCSRQRVVPSLRLSASPTQDLAVAKPS